MAGTPTTRWQIGAHRFSVRRLDHALVLGDTSMRHEPLRSTARASAVGVVVAVLILAGCAALAFVRPAARIGDAVIVLDDESGALYVVEDDTLHPASDLASARLFAGRPDEPTAVGPDEIARRARGAAIGIGGAPQALPVTTGAMVWSVCEESDNGTTDVTVEPVGTQSVAPRRALDPDDALVWRRDGVDYLVHGQVRARVDLQNTAVTRALGLEDAVPTPVSAGLFDAVPEAPEIVTPTVIGSGAAAPYPIGGRPVGSVVTVDLGDRSEHYVVLQDGVQAIGAATAQLLRFSDSAGRVGVDAVPPDVIARAPRTAAPLAVDTFPERPPIIVTGGDATCVEWVGPDESTGRGAQTRMTIGATADSRAVALAGADGAGDGLDTFFVAPGSGLYVATTGQAADDPRRDSAFYVADTGTRFGVPFTQDAEALGLGDPAPAPWPVVGLLPTGPALTVDAARVGHDGS